MPLYISLYSCMDIAIDIDSRCGSKSALPPYCVPVRYAASISIYIYVYIYIYICHVSSHISR